MKVTILGSGSWGTAISVVLSDNGHDVLIWGNSEEQVASLNTNHESLFMRGSKIPETIKATTAIEEAFASDVDMYVIAVPSFAFREICGHLRNHMKNPALIVSITKGIELPSLKTMSVIVEEELLPSSYTGFSILTGPSHAEEVIQRSLTTITATSKDEEAAIRVQKAFHNSYFRVYRNTDVVGVEIAGTAKNALALAAGIGDGLNLGDNAKAALITRGLTEILLLVLEKGGDRDTLYGLTGLGDLVVTAFSRHSRNRKAGELLGRGYSIEAAEKEIGMVVEGVHATEALYTMAQNEGLELPIIKSLYEVLYSGGNPKTMIDELMNREMKPEKKHSDIVSKVANHKEHSEGVV